MRPAQGSARFRGGARKVGARRLGWRSRGRTGTKPLGRPLEGGIEIPNAPLAVEVDLVQTDDAWTGTIDIPAQDAVGLPLTILRIDGETIEFAIAGVPGDPTFKGRRSDSGIAGTFSQGGVDFPFALTRAQR